MLKKHIECGIIILLFLFPFSTIQAVTLHVDIATGSNTNSGHSWNDALESMTEATQRSYPGDEILIAQGIYHESLVLKENLQVKGGYISGGSLRDWLAYPTVVNGDGIRRCAEASNGAVIDGMQFVNGFAIQGGAISIVSMEMYLSHCLFDSCMASGGNPNGGGALYINQSQPIIFGCIFSNNQVLTAADITSGETCGGAALIWAASPRFIDCVFENNSVMSEQDNMLLLGGAAWCIASQSVFKGCSFNDNEAGFGGAVGWWNRSMPDFDSCHFDGNHATSSGGALCMIYHEMFEPDSTHRVIDCVFEENSAATGGAIAILRHASYELINCRFSENSAMIAGGAIHLENAAITARLCTFYANSLPQSEYGNGSAIHTRYGQLELHDSIVAFNTGAPAIDQDPPQPNEIIIESSNVYGNTSGNYSPEVIDRTGLSGNLSADPLFVLDAQGEYCLSEPDTGDSAQIDLGRSPCINSADSDYSEFHSWYRSTRTDKIPDRSIPDMGYHRLIDSPYIASAFPGPEDNFINGSRIGYLCIRDQTAGIDRDSILIQVNDLLVNPIFIETWRGWEISFELDPSIPDCSLLDINVTAQSLDQPPESLQSQSLICISPGCPAQPTPQPTPPPASIPPQLSFSQSDLQLSAYDHAHISYSVYNPNFSPVLLDLYLCLEIYGDYLFYPFWNQELHAQLTFLYPGETQSGILLDFVLPDGVPAAGPFYLYGVMTGSGSYALLGEISMCTITIE